MVKRIFVAKKPQFAQEAAALLKAAREFLGIHLAKLVIYNRYDVADIEEKDFAAAVQNVFSEPQVDDVFTEVPVSPQDHVFAVEFLPGQFDQRADSAMQCVQFLTQKERPLIRTAKVYVASGELTGDDLAKLKNYVINPVECREASLALPQNLSHDVAAVADVPILQGFSELDFAGLNKLINTYDLAMDVDDLVFCQAYFNGEKRDPSLTELKVIDTYWSDHCRHTTFHTVIDDVTFNDALLQQTFDAYQQTRAQVNDKKPICFMDIATIAVKYLKKTGALQKLDESEEINACTVKIEVEIAGQKEPWLLLFKNETHNHPTEIEPFGGAATCIGGAIRDPLSGRAYVYGAMRLTGASDPRQPVTETLKGKLPQRKIVTTAAAGYSSYGNQIGLATGIVREFYHPGYAAKHMEVGAVIAAVPKQNVRRETPMLGDIVLLLGGRTGRDGIGGATGSSKAHDEKSVTSLGAEVQKGNAPEERKLQRLFRNPELSRMIKRCNDFGAGGVSVAIGELCDGLLIDLDKVPKKYEGLNGTELAISESQERMAVVIAASDKKRFTEIVESENILYSEVAKVNDSNRMVMKWRGKKIVDLSRAFLDSNGAEKHIKINAPKAAMTLPEVKGGFKDNYIKLLSDLRYASQQGLAERFDATIGKGSVQMPFGGRYQKTPVQSMVQKISVEKQDTSTISYMSYGFDPYISAQSPFHGAYYAVISSLSKLVASGAAFSDVYLSLQEYFAKLGKDENKWGLPLSALLGAFKAQMDYQVAAIGGKDSMSGTFENLDVPPTLISFAVTCGDVREVISPEFKAVGHEVLLLTPEFTSEKLPKPSSLLQIFAFIEKLNAEHKIAAAFACGEEKVAGAVAQMCFGNKLGFNYEKANGLADIFGFAYGSFVVELAHSNVSEFEDLKRSLAGFELQMLGRTTETKSITYENEVLELQDLQNLYEATLEDVYPRSCTAETEVKNLAYDVAQSGNRSVKKYGGSVLAAKPKVLIPVFPGTNCEYDTAKTFAAAGAAPEVFVVKNLTPQAVMESVAALAARIKQSQIVFLPGGFSGGDEPDGSAKFITALFRNAAVREAVADLLEHRDGLMAGICNGFQALIKLGLVPFGKITEPFAGNPTLTFNLIGRHQSRIVRTRIASNKSPWLSGQKVGEVFAVPISHGEGRFIASADMLNSLQANGQIATQYADIEGNASMDVEFNPNGSIMAVEGITSPDGRVFGKMGHSERCGEFLYQNVPGCYDLPMFRNAVAYFKI